MERENREYILQIILEGCNLDTQQSETTSGADVCSSPPQLLPPLSARKQLEVAAGLLFEDLRIKVLELLHHCRTR